MPNKVLAVVVTFNRLDKLKTCLSNLKMYAAQADILVLNNASTDGTKDWLASQVDAMAISVINEEKNVGGAGGFSDGMKWGVQHGYEYVWIMDDDCFVNDQTLPQLLHADEILKGNYGWLSSIALWRDGMPCKMNRQKFTRRFYEEYAQLLQYSILNSYQASFVSLFVKASTIKEVGLPIKDFFIWGDDVEYTRRIAIRSGKPSFVVGASTVLHDMNGNTGSDIATDSDDRIARYCYAFRNEGYLWRLEGLRGTAFFAAKCGYNILKIFANAKNKRLRRCWIVIKNAFSGYFCFKPKVEFVE